MGKKSIVFLVFLVPVLSLILIANVNASPDTIILRPNADGHELDYSVYPADTFHYVAVDDVTPDDDDTYLNSSVNYAEDYWGLQDWGGSGTINKITVWLRVRDVLTDTERFQICIYTYNTEYFSDFIQDTTSWTDYSNEWTTNPKTASAWTWTEINDLEIGIISRAKGGWNGKQRVTQAWVVVDYIPSPPVPEFPIGLAVEILFIPLLIYIFWRSKQRKKQFQ